MNIRWFLRGVGVGIVVTALILCISYRGIQKDSNVIQQAKKLGMVFPETETGDVSQAAKDLAEQLAGQGADAKDGGAEKAASGAAVKEESKKDKKAREKLEKSSEDISSASQYQGDTTTFVVRSGLLSSSVAREMQQAGIIDDADTFDDYLEQNGYGRMLRSGSYKIPKGADYETIAKIITKQN